METIPEWGQKIKVVADDALAEWGVVALVFVLALASFGLGRLSAEETVLPPVSVGQTAPAHAPAALFMGELIVASRTGSAYYYPWCAGAQKLTPGNQVWFPSEAAAQKAGYTPAKACKGLTN